MNDDLSVVDSDYVRVRMSFIEILGNLGAPLFFGDIFKNLDGFVIEKYRKLFIVKNDDAFFDIVNKAV